LAYLVGAVFVFHPLSPFSNDVLSRAGIGDPAQMTWFLSYTPHALTHGLNPFATNLIDYPTGVDLASNTSVPLLGILAWPLTATLGPIASLNVFMRLGIFLSAAALFFVLRRWCRSQLACFIGGLCFGFGPYVIGQEVFNTHINLLFVPIFPLLALLLDELLRRQRWSWKRSGILLGLSASAEMLIAPELLSDFGVVSAIVVIYLVCRYPRLVQTKIAYIARAFATSLAIFLIICGDLIVQMVNGPNHIHGAVYSIPHLQSFYNTLPETLLPTMQQLLTTTSLSSSLHLPTQDVNELGGYLSIPLIVIMIVTVIVWRRRSGVVAFGIATLVALVLSFGESFKLGSTKIDLPELLFVHLPLLNSTVPDRFSLDALLGASALFAIGIDRTIAAIKRRNTQLRWPLYGAVGLVVIIVLATLMPRLPIDEQKLIYPTNTADEIAGHVVKGGVVLSYPYPSPPLNEAMVWQAESGFTYSLLGAYATVPEPGGNGQEWPLLQQPPQVQSYLSRLELGRRSHYAKVSPPMNSSQLCAYVAKYGVTDMAILHREVNSTLALAYFESIPHSVTFRSSTLTILQVVNKANSPC
jgi:hypothetical protein